MDVADAKIGSEVIYIRNGAHGVVTGVKEVSATRVVVVRWQTGFVCHVTPDTIRLAGK